MKILIALLMLGTAATASADINCRKQVSNSRVEYTDIQSWPEMLTSRHYEDCVGAGPVSFCQTGRMNPQLDHFQVCGYQIDQRFDCQTREGWNRNGTVIETRCPRYGIRAVVSMDPFGAGRLYCVRGGRVERTWNLGQCQ